MSDNLQKGNDDSIAQERILLLRHRQKLFTTATLIALGTITIVNFLLYLAMSFVEKDSTAYEHVMLLQRYINYATIVIALASFPFFFYITRISNELQDVRLGIRNLRRELPKDFEGRLIDINLRYLDQYYLETRIQANKSFLSSLAVGFMSFILIGFSIILLLMDKVEAGAITLASGTVTQFISAVFFYLFNKTVLSMASYHQRLVFTQNIALAMKLVQGLSGDKKAEMTATIIDKLLFDLNAYLAGKVGPPTQVS